MIIFTKVAFRPGRWEISRDQVKSCSAVQVADALDFSEPARERGSHATLANSSGTLGLRRPASPQRPFASPLGPTSGVNTRERIRSPPCDE